MSTPTTTQAAVESAPRVPPLTPTPNGRAFDQLEPLEGVRFELTEVITDFLGVIPEVFDVSPLAIADTDRNGRPEIIASMARDFCVLERRWPCVTQIEWDGNSYRFSAYEWSLYEASNTRDLDVPESYAAYVYVVDLLGDGSEEIIVSIDSTDARSRSALFVFDFDPATARYKAIYAQSLDQAPVSFYTLPNELLTRPGVILSDWAVVSAQPSSLNTVYLMTTDANALMTTVLLQDTSATLLLGRIPGLVDTYLLRERIFDRRTNDIVSYRVDGMKLTLSENPIPVDGGLRGVYLGKNLMNGSIDEEFLILLKVDTQCTLGYTLICDQTVGDSRAYSPANYIEVYQWEKAHYRLLARLSADPDDRQVYRLIIGDVDNDGQDEIITSTGMMYKWVHGVPRLSRDLEKAGEEIWTYLIDDNGKKELYAPLTGLIQDVNSDGKQELVLLAPTIKAAQSGQNEASSLFIVNVRRSR